MNRHEESGAVAGVCFLIAAGIAGIATLDSCVEHRVTAPQLDTALDKLATLKPPVQCRIADLLPVPQTARLVIDGDAVEADAGGEQLLRGYVHCRGER